MVCRWIVTLGFREWRRATNALLYVGVLATCDAAALAGSPPGDKPSQAEQVSTTLRVALVVDGTVSMPVIRTMRAQAERIWAPYSVQIHWLTPDSIDALRTRPRGAGRHSALALPSVAGERGADARMLSGPARWRPPASDHRVPDTGPPTGRSLDGALRRTSSCVVARMADGSAARASAGSRARALSCWVRTQRDGPDARTVRCRRYLGGRAGSMLPDPRRG